MPRVPDPTFRGEGIIRIDDVLAHPDYGNRAAPGMPKGHLPVRSYLAVPVVSPRRQSARRLVFRPLHARRVLAP